MSYEAPPPHFAQKAKQNGGWHAIPSKAGIHLRTESVLPAPQPPDFLQTGQYPLSFDTPQPDTALQQHITSALLL